MESRRDADGLSPAGSQGFGGGGEGERKTEEPRWREIRNHRQGSLARSSLESVKSLRPREASSADQRREVYV